MPARTHDSMAPDDWIPRMEQVEADVRDLKAALLGTLDGRPGLRAQMEAVMHHVKQNAEISARNSEMLDALRLDKAKVAGIIVATGAIVGVGLKLLHL